MSKLILLIFILLLSISSAALAFPNEPTSFRGLSWGASIEELKEKYPNSYEIKDDRVNTLSLLQVIYKRLFSIFFDDKLI